MLMDGQMDLKEYSLCEGHLARGSRIYILVQLCVEFEASRAHSGPGRR